MKIEQRLLGKLCKVTENVISVNYVVLGLIITLLIVFPSVKNSKISIFCNQNALSLQIKKLQVKIQQRLLGKLFQVIENFISNNYGVLGLMITILIVSQCKKLRNFHILQLKCATFTNKKTTAENPTENLRQIFQS